MKVGQSKNAVLRFFKVCLGAFVLILWDRNSTYLKFSYFWQLGTCKIRPFNWFDTNSLRVHVLFNSSFPPEKLMFDIRSATASDFPLIQKMAYETWPDTFGDILSKEQISYMLEMMYSSASLKEQTEKKNHQFLIAGEGNENLGFASFEIHYKGLAKTKIHKIYILPAAQQRGIGKLLINRIADIAKDNQDEILSLNVNRHNLAFEFYKKMGFEKVGEENIDIGNGFLMEDFIMEKILV